MIRHKNSSNFKAGMSALLCLFTAGMVKAEINKDPFPAFSALKESVKIPRNAKLTVSEDGNFLINGKPRYLPGAIYYEDVPRTLKRHTTGYPAELNWLYEDVLDYEGYQRVGLDATGIFATSDWIKKYRDNSARGGDTINDPLVKKIVTSGIPLYLDFTCAPWHHGFIKYEEGKLPAKAAFNVCGVDNNHWMPYSATTPEGRELYFEMWRRGAESSLQIGAKPFVYELFNEPNYNDWSEFNRNLFAERMRKKYKSIKKLNAEWKTSYKNFKEMSSFKSNYENTPLFIEWTKFMEDCFADICRAGTAEIKKIDKRPDILFCVQPLGTVMCNVNFYKTNQYMNAIGAPTGGGNALMAKLLKALAKGKPIFDGETYMGNTRASIRNQFWLQYSRGFNASFVFKWDRRPYDQYWPKADEAGGKLVAERFPYLMLNPYALPTTELLGIMDAKTEILKVNDFFTPRDRGVKPEIAFLFSTASKRLARAQGSIKHNQNEDYALALEYAPLAFDVVFEEQLQQDILKNYKIAIIAGIEVGNPEMIDALEKFVRNGGMLIIGQEAMQNNEYGFKRADDSFPGIFPGKALQQNMTMLTLGNFKTMAAPYSDVSFDKTWSVAAKLGDEPAILTKKLGKGEIFYLNTKMHLRALSSLFEELVKEKHVAPSCIMRNYLNDERISYVEVNKAVRGNEVGYILFNNSSGIQLVRFRPTEKNMTFADPLEGKLMQAQNGEYFICLLPNSPRIIIGGSEDTLKKRFGSLSVESFEDAAKAGKAVVRAEALKNKKSGKAFNIEPNLIKTINLRANVNSGFNGGWNWIKKPETGIQNAPYWGVVNCNGVPFGFVRGDHNEERTCIVTGPDGAGNVKGIEINSPVKNFFFLHSALQNDNNVNFKYVINYQDGSKTEIPIRNGIQIDDWRNIDANRKKTHQAVPGWSNSQGNGFWIYRFPNPFPTRQVSTVDVVSEPSGTGALIASLSIELPSSPEQEFYPLQFFPPNFRYHTWGGLKAEINGDEITFHLDEKSIHWCSCSFTFLKPLDIPEGFENGSLVFEINGGNDIWGNHRGGQTLQMKFLCQDASGKDIKTGDAQIASTETIDNNPDSWQIVELPLKLMLTQEARKMKGFFIQFMRLPQEHFGVRLRNFRLRKPLKETAGSN